jgi:molybdopterin synthase catalytic subunit
MRTLMFAPRVGSFAPLITRFCPSNISASAGNMGWRAWSRGDRALVRSVRVRPDRERMDGICREMEQRPGIFRILAEANEGELKPGDDLLFLVVAGDIRENVKSTFAELLDRIKAEAILKEELTA